MKDKIFIIISCAVYAETDDGTKVCIESSDMPEKVFSSLRVGNEIELEIVMESEFGYTQGKLLPQGPIESKSSLSVLEK